MESFDSMREAVSMEFPPLEGDRCFRLTSVDLDVGWPMRAWAGVALAGISDFDHCA
jgi:hypothetical protein